MALLEEAAGCAKEDTAPDADPDEEDEEPAQGQDGEGAEGESGAAASRCVPQPPLCRVQEWGQPSQRRPPPPGPRSGGSASVAPGGSGCLRDVPCQPPGAPWAAAVAL